MTIKSAAVKTGIAAVALTALGLVAAAPASAHTNNMYGVILDADPQDVPAFQGFGTVGKTDGVATPLPTDATLNQEEIWGIEVFNEKGTALGRQQAYWIAPWDHSTGALGERVNLS